MIRDVTPMLAVEDIDRAARFLERGLGFTCRVQRDGYAYLTRDAGAIRLVEAAPGSDMADPVRQVAVYIDADDVDALWEAHRDVLERPPQGHVRAPFDQPYGQREFHVIHGPVLFFVGQRATADA